MESLMIIEYLIARADGSKVISGRFNADDRIAQGRFARRAREAWADGHAVITKAIEPPL